MLYTIKSGLANVFEALAEMHTVTGWDPAVGAIFQQIAEALRQ